MDPQTKKIAMIAGGVGLVGLAAYYYWDCKKAGTAQVATTQTSTTGQASAAQQVVKGNQTQKVSTQNGGSVAVTQKTSQGQPTTMTNATIAPGENAIINAPAGSQVEVKQKGAQTTVSVQHPQ